MNTHTARQNFPPPADAAALPGGVVAPGAAGGFQVSDSDTSAGFVKLMRGETTLELLRDHKAFALLTLIAYRARYRVGGFNLHNLQPGEALVGDHRACGLTPKGYREAKARLERWGFAAFHGTNKGTVARLIDSRVFDINLASRGEQNGTPRASKGRARGEQGATNKKGKKGDNEQEGKPPIPPKGAAGQGLRFRSI